MDIESLINLKKHQKISLRRAEKQFHSRFESGNPFKRKRYYGLSQTETKVKRLHRFDKRPHQQLPLSKIDKPLRKPYSPLRNRDDKAGVTAFTRRHEPPKANAENKINVTLPVDFSQGRMKRKTSEIPDDEKIKQPRKFRKMDEDEIKRNRRFLSVFQHHIAEAKKELKKEEKSAIKQSREELDKKVNETIIQDRLQFRKDFQKKAKERALRRMQRKESQLRLTEWEIQSKLCENLIEKLSSIAQQKSNFLLTEANPPIYFAPKLLDADIRPKLEKTRKFQQLLLQKEIEKIRSSLPEKPVSSVIEESSDEEKERNAAARKNPQPTPINDDKTEKNGIEKSNKNAQAPSEEHAKDFRGSRRVVIRRESDDGYETDSGAEGGAAENKKDRPGADRESARDRPAADSGADSKREFVREINASQANGKKDLFGSKGVIGEVERERSEILEEAENEEIEEGQAVGTLEAEKKESGNERDGNNI